MSGAISAQELLITSKSSSSNLDLESASTSVVIDSGHMNLSGQGAHINVTSRSSSIDAASFHTDSGTVSADSSHIELNTTEDLVIIRDDSSTIQNAGSGAGASESVRGTDSETRN